MKKYLISGLSLWLIAACSTAETPDTQKLIAEKNVEGLRARQASLVAQNNTVKAELNLVMEAIDRLDTDKKRALVTVLSLKEAPFKHTVLLQGVVKTDQNLVLNAEFMGTVKAIHVAEGQQVAKGELLVTIDDGGLAKTVEVQRSQLKLAKTVFERQKRLWDQQIGSEIEYLQTKTTYESLKKTVQQLNEQLGKAKLYAPFSGRIDDIMIEVGTLVSPGVKPLLRLINTERMYVEADVPERYFPSIKKGTPAEVEIPVYGYSYQSTVSHKGTHINTGNRTFKVSLSTKNAEALAPNIISTIRLVDYENTTALVIPLEVISENFAGQQYVYVVNKTDKAEKRLIQTGYVQDDMVEVLEGLEPKDRVIDEGARLVKENENVLITNVL